MNETDIVLLDSWMRERDAEAFQTLAKRYAGMVYGTCKRILGNPTEAEDAAQECFEVLATTQKPVGEYLAPWLHRVACNKSLTRLRSEHRRKEREEQFVAELEAGREPAWSDLYRFVDEAIAELPDQLRIPVVAHFLDDQTHAAIGQALDVPRSTITHRIDNGIELVRKTLKSKGVTIAGLALAGLIKANAAEAAPSALLMNLGRLALSGAQIAPVSAAAAAAAKVSAGFWTAKTVIAAVMGLAVLAGGTAGYVTITKVFPFGSVMAPLISLEKAAKNTLPAGVKRGVPHPGVPGKAAATTESFLPAKLLGSISGRVCDATTGRGIPFSTVCALGPSGETKVYASLTGEYAINGLMPGQYGLCADAPFGYLNAGVANEMRADVLPGSQVTRVDFERAKAVSISGTVRDQAGRPVANASVSATGAGPRIPECISGKDGSFRLANVQANQRHIRISAEANGMVSSYANRYAIGAEDLEGVAVVLAPGARVSGKLVDRAGRPVAGMEMLAWPKDPYGGLPLPKSVTSEQGTFDFFPLTDGGYHLCVSPPGSETRDNNTLDEVELTSGEELRGLVLEYDLSSGMRIAGRVTDASGKPLERKKVACFGPISAAAVTDKDGRYELARLPEGLYTLFANERIVKKGFLPDGNDVDIVLPDAGKILCRMVDEASGAPVKRFQAQALPAGMPLYSDLNGRMPHVYDAEGRCWMDLEPGDYQMCVRAPGYRAVAKDMHVEAATDTPAEQEIALEPMPPLEIRATDPQGHPISGAGVYFDTPDVSKEVALWEAERFAPYRSPVGKTGEDGIFRSDWPVLDDGFVYVRHPAYTPASAPLRFGEPIQICLRPGGVVQGTVEVDGITPAQGIRAGLRYPDCPELGTLWGTTDGNGGFSIEHARPGDAVVFAKVDWRISDTGYSRQEVSQPVRVADLGTTEVALRISAGDCTLTGGVLLEGRPFGEFSVFAAVTMPDGREVRRSTDIDINGSFVLDGLPAGEGLVSIVPRRFNAGIPLEPMTPIPVSIPPGQNNHVEFAFTANELH